MSAAMAESGKPAHRKGMRLKDARGRWVTQLDPVRLHLLNQRTPIPDETLHAMVDELLPGAKRKRLIQVLALVLGFGVVVGGNVIYFTYFSSWKGLDPVNTTIYVIQFVVLMSGPLLAFRMARREYAHRVAGVMLRHRHCPHCGYDIRHLPVGDDATTVCPECGSVWRLPR